MYLAMKLHFTNPKFDYFISEGRTNVKESTYHERNDFWFFETLAKKLSFKEIQDYLLASFVLASNPQKVWIGDIKRTGKDSYLVWKKQMDSLTYTFSQDCDTVVHCVENGECTLNGVFGSQQSEDYRRPLAYRLCCTEKISLESLLIYDQIMNFIPVWDKHLREPLWELMSFKIKKYKPFLSIPVDKYRMLCYNKFRPLH